MAYEFDRVERLKAELKSLQPLTKENQEKLDKKFRMEFNYNSNHMEGNTLTYSETELLLFFDESKGNHTMREYDEMRAHDAAFKLVEEWAGDKERPLTEQNIKNLNEIILVRPFWKEAVTPEGQSTRRLIKVGNYKEHPNSVILQNGEMFHYASPSETPILMQELIDWYRTEENAIHPCTLAAMLHYKFVRIHPFDDGNGRVARLLMNYVFLRNNFPPVIIKSADKANYLRVLHSADVGDYEPLIDYIAEQLSWSLQISIKAAKGESIDEPGDLDKKIRELNRKLKIADGAKINVRKSGQSLKDVLENTIWPLIDSVQNTLTELQIHFRDSRAQMSINEGGFEFLRTGREQLKQLLIVNPIGLSTIRFRLSLLGFRTVSGTTFDVTTELTVTFHTNVYEIETGTGKLLSKLYDEVLMVEEFNQLVERLGSKIVDDIEARLGKIN
jgi:Fic family protein